MNLETPILAGTVFVNNTQPGRVFTMLKSEIGDLSGKRIAILGLTFKPNTDDVRESPARTLIRLLLDEGAIVVCHDPIVTQKESNAFDGMPVIYERTVTNALKKAHAVVLVTAWESYKKITPHLLKTHMKKAFLVDGRRIFNKDLFEKAGVTYKGIGLGNI